MVKVTRGHMVLLKFLFFDKIGVCGIVSVMNEE